MEVTSVRPPAIDLVLAGLFLVTSLGAIITGEVDEGPAAITVPVVLAATLGLALRSRWPLLLVVLVAGGEIAQSLVTGQSSGTLMGLVLILVAAYTAGALLDEGLAAVGLTLLLMAEFWTEWRAHGTDYAFLIVEVGGAWLLGRAARSLRLRASYAEQHQRDLAQLAVADERARIARELHDVVAHSLSVIAVQADAAEAALVRDPDRAAAPLAAIQTSARSALSDMRQLLHLLRVDESGEPDERVPARGLSDLPALFAGVRDAGLPLETDVHPLPELPAGTELTVYRLTQEALTNVVKHAGRAPTRLSIDHDGAGVRVTVRNAPGDAGQDGDSGSGQGLIGARERVRAAGGSMDAGPTVDGGFELVAVLPVGERGAS